MLMRAYRHAYSPEGGTRILSQNGLLNLMAQVDSRYSGRYDHSAVARWESGAIRPSRERLEAFGQALDLSAAEIDGLLALAGLGANTGEAAETGAVSDPAYADEGRSTGAPAGLNPKSSAVEPNPNVSLFYPRHAIRYVSSRFLLPGACVAIAGYFLALFGWNSSFPLAMYVGVALCALTAQGFLRLRRSDDLGDLFFVSVFFLLSIPLLHAPLTWMDAYGLYSIRDFAGSSIPFTLSLIVNLLVATISGLMFNFISRWQYSRPTGEKSVYGRAAWIVLPPIAFVYAFLLAFSNVGFWIIGLGLLTLLAGAFAAMLVLHDRDNTIGSWDRKFLLCTMVAVTLVLSALGLAAILVTYAQPSSYDVSEQGLFYSWATDFDALGYPADEYFERSRLAVTWASLTTLAYMVIVIGGRLIVTIYALGGRDSSITDSGKAVVTTETSSLQRKRRRSRLDFRNHPGWIAGLRILRPSRNR